ncbi:hypothetical protein, partial [Sphingomonas sp. BK481]|uniref:hypothetical protein n=1 Tax=Sphingomonas sp. BK481 TaxID=2586981 RepID=UPI001C84B156
GRAGLIRGASSGARRHLSSTTLIPRDPFSTVSGDFCILDGKVRSLNFSVSLSRSIHAVL